MWELVGGTLFDRATAEPPDGRAGDPGARERPPYNAEWEAKYLANIARVAEDRFPDPVTTLRRAGRLPAAAANGRRLRVRGHARSRPGS